MPRPPRNAAPQGLPRSWAWVLPAVLFLLWCTLGSAQPNKLTTTLDGITFDSDYDNGSLGSVSLAAPDEFDATLYTETGEKGQRRYWFRFTLSGVSGRTLTLNLPRAQDALPVLRVLDPGPGAWRRLTSTEAPDINTLHLTFDTNTMAVELAFFDPMSYSETLAAVTNLTSASPHATVSVLGTSYENRDLHLVTVNNPAYPEQAKYRVWVHTRVHAGEVTATHAMLGFLEQVLEDSETGRRLREHVIFHIVPQVNVDGISRGLTRWDAQGIDIESEWCDIRVPEAALLKAQVDALMSQPNPISLALNLHSTVGNFTDSFFFKHLSPSVSVAFEGIQQDYIDAVDAVTPLFDNLSAQTSQLNPCTYIESYFWNNWGESVMALTYEGHFYRRITDNAWTDGAHYRELGKALAQGLIGYYALPPSSDPDLVPEITGQPMDQLVRLGQLFSFSVGTTSSVPVAYQWWWNGAPLPGATNAVHNDLATDVTQAGGYAVVAANMYGSVTSALGRLVIVDDSDIPVAFADDFEQDSSTRWTESPGFASGAPDYTSDYGFDYSTYFSVFQGSPIPSAPTSEAGTTRGLKLTVNDNDAVGSPAAVTLYPLWQSFSGEHTLTFDMWINYPGGTGGAGGSGTTENAFFGLNCSGANSNWDHPSASPSDGVWFTVNGDGDAVSDYRAHVGGTNTSPILLAFDDSGLAASGAIDASAASEPFISFFPAPTYETPGVPGKNWVRVEVGQSTADVLRWRINGQLLAERTNQTAFTSGNVMLGFADLYSSLASPVADSFMLYDNVRVELNPTSLAPVITQQPHSRTNIVGETTLFSVQVDGVGPLHYQWRFEGTNLPAATNSSLSLPGLGVDDAGTYDVRVSNAVATLTSDAAYLTVVPASTDAPTVLTQLDEGGLSIHWPATHIGWRLEAQTNAPGLGLSSSWSPVAGSALTNTIQVPLDVQGSVFFRLVYP